MIFTCDMKVNLLARFVRRHLLTLLCLLCGEKVKQLNKLASPDSLQSPVRGCFGSMEC